MHDLGRIAIGVGLLLSWGCGGKQRGAPDTSGAIRFTAVQNRTLKIMEATPAGIRELRSVELPADVASVEWAGAEPVVQLVSDPRDEDASVAKRNGEIGRIAAAGYEPFAALPASTWTIKPDPEGRDRFEQPVWRLIVSPDGVIWQGRCEWGYYGDSDECLEFVYARIHPAPAAGAAAPVTTMREEPRSGRAAFQLPPIAPSRTTQVALADFERPATAGDPEPDPASIRILRCTQAGKTIEFPTEDDRLNGVHGEIRWLSTEPPIYSIERWEYGEAEYLRTIFFEGCAESQTYDQVEVGPNGAFAIVGKNASVRSRDRELGTLDGVDFIRFAPAK